MSKTSGDDANGGNQAEKWQRVKTRLRAELGEQVYSSWFGSAELEGVKNGVIYLSVPTRFLQKWLQSHYVEQLLECCNAELEDISRAEFRVRGPHDQAVKRAAQSEAGRTPPNGQSKSGTHGTRSGPAFSEELSRTGCEGIDGSPLDPRFTFHSYVTGTSNRLAQAAALQVAESVFDAPTRYNPLFLHAGVGLGKTHLLHAIAWEVKRLHPEARVLYLTVERFMYSFTEALRSRDHLAYKEKLRNIDLLLIDDMEFLQGRANHNEFGHTLNTMIDGRKQVVVASDRAPSLLEGLDARMRDRLAGGLVAEIGALDYDLRLRILQSRAKEAAAVEKGFAVTDQVLEFLANRLTESGRELEGSIRRLRADFHLNREPITVAKAEHIIRDLTCGGEPRRIQIEDILRIVSKHFGVNRSDLLSKRRTRSIVRPRQIGMYLSKQLTSRSLPEIGRRFGGRDHTTVIHAIRVVQQLISDDPTLREEIELLKRLLRE